MSADTNLDLSTIQQQGQNYANTAVYTELGGNSSKAKQFSYKGAGTGGYVFGLYQFNTLMTGRLSHKINDTLFHLKYEEQVTSPFAPPLSRIGMRHE